MREYMSTKCYVRAFQVSCACLQSDFFLHIDGRHRWPHAKHFPFSNGWIHQKRGRIFVTYHTCHSWRASSCRFDDANFHVFLSLSWHPPMLGVSFRSCRSRFSCLRVLGSPHDPVTDERFSDALTEVTCLRKCTQRYHVCIEGFFWRLIPTVEQVTFVRFVGFANREFVEFFYDAFQLLPFLGVVKWHSIEDFQGFRSNAVEKKS